MLAHVLLLAVPVVVAASPERLGRAEVKGPRVYVALPSGGVMPVDVGCRAVEVRSSALLHVGCADGRVRSFDLAEAPRLVAEAKVTSGPAGLREALRARLEALVQAERPEPVLLGPSAAVARAEPPRVRRNLSAPPSPPQFGDEPAPRPAEASRRPLDASPAGPGLQQGTPPPTPPVARGATPAVAQPAPTARVEQQDPAPDRFPGAVRAFAAVRLLGTSGGVRATVNAGLDAALTWHAPIPLAVRARCATLLHSGADEVRASGGLDVLGDFSWVGFGLGVGFTPTRHLDPRGGTVTIPAVLVLSPLLRFGSLDGVHFVAQAHLPPGGEPGAFGVEGQLQLPLVGTAQARLRGALTPGVWSWAEIGFSFLLTTPGREGTAVRVTPSVGLGGPVVGAAGAMGLGVSGSLALEVRT